MNDWSDPNHDVIGDIKNFIHRCKEQYERMHENGPCAYDDVPTSGGKEVQNNLINETQSLIEETSKEEKKRRSARDFVSDDVNPTSLHLLAGLNQLGKHIYAGTVSGAEKEKRRAKNKRARTARRKSR